MSKTDIWMPIYIGDYLADTMDLSLSEHGAYFLAMMTYWRNNGPLPDVKFRKIVKEEFETISVFFTFSDGLWSHRRIDEEIQKAATRKESQRKRTEAATLARSASKHKRNAERNVVLNENVTFTSSSSPSPSNKNKEKIGKPILKTAFSPTHIPIHKFTEAFKLNTGKDYTPNWGKDSKICGNLIKSLEATHGGTEQAAQYIAQQIDFYFSWQKPEWWDFGVFISSFNRMQAAQSTPKRMDAKQEKDLDRYRRAMIAED